MTNDEPTLRVFTGGLAHETHSFSSAPIPEHLPLKIREELEMARNYFAMAYDQSNMDRLQLYPKLVGDSFVKALRALEMALSDRLECNPKTPLTNMIKTAQERGLLVDDAQLEQRARSFSHVWPWLIKTRNDIVHGNPDPEVFGPATAHLFGFLVGAITELFVDAHWSPPIAERG